MFNITYWGITEKAEISGRRNSLCKKHSFENAPSLLSIAWFNRACTHNYRPLLHLHLASVALPSVITAQLVLRLSNLFFAESNSSQPINSRTDSACFKIFICSTESVTTGSVQEALMIMHTWCPVLTDGHSHFCRDDWREALQHWPRFLSYIYKI